MSNIVLHDDKGNKYKVSMSNEINRGGEGMIVSLNNGKVVKLYFEASRAISQRKIDELSLLDNKLFIKPEIAVSGDYNGFIMPELDCVDYFPLYSLYSLNFAMKRGLPSDYQTKIADKLIAAVKNAHDNNIIIGDLNPFNVMVNNNLDVKFIDVDSYETTSYKHNDKLLEEIRDYKNNGFVTKNSDYFALAVCIFNLFTGIHPYKGIHNIYRDNLKDREVNDLSLVNKKEFGNIKVPKFYKAISDTNLLGLFEKLFNNNERFLLDLHGAIIKQIKFDKVICSDDLLITTILSENIVSVTSSQNYLCITTDTHHLIMSTVSKGVVMNLTIIDKSINIILTDKYIYGLKGNKLKLFDIKKQEFIDITSLAINNVHCVKQYENILLIITANDTMYKVYLDETFCNSVKYTVENVYHKSFIKRDGLFQRLGINNIIFYNNGKTLNSCIYPNNIADIQQVGNVGLITSVQNSKIVYELFSINKMGKMNTIQIPEQYNFTANEKFILLFKDDKLRFIDKETLNEVISFKINDVDDYQMLSTKSGIIAYNSSNVKLLNTK